MVKRILKGFVAIIMSVSTMCWVTCRVYGYDCYKEWYMIADCFDCDDSLYNYSYKDSCSAGHPRQNGIKLCSTHMNNISTKASYYKRGFSDYNCLAYALGKNGVQSWTWPASWGLTGPTLSEFKNYISGFGYKYTTNSNEATGKYIIYVYENNGYITHFARKYTLDKKVVEGAATISKWGSCSLYTTSTIDPYTSSGYGKLVLICFK